MIFPITVAGFGIVVCKNLWDAMGPVRDLEQHLMVAELLGRGNWAGSFILGFVAI